MTSKQRAYLKSLAMKMEPIIQIGKSSLTPEGYAGGKNPLSGGTGYWKENRPLQRRQRR